MRLIQRTSVRVIKYTCKMTVTLMAIANPQDNNMRENKRITEIKQFKSHRILNLDISISSESAVHS